MDLGPRPQSATKFTWASLSLSAQSQDWCRYDMGQEEVQNGWDGQERSFHSQGQALFPKVRIQEIILIFSSDTQIVQ